jgi:hypothetical protein
LSVEQQQPHPGADIDDAGPRTTSSRFERGEATTGGVDVALLPEGCLPSALPKPVPIVIPQHEVAFDAGPFDDLELRPEAALCFGSLRILGRRQTVGVDVVSQENDDGLHSLRRKVPTQGLEDRLTTSPGRSRVSDEINPDGDVLRGKLRDWGGGWRDAACSRSHADDEPGPESCHYRALVCCALDLRPYSRPIATASSTQTNARTRFTRAKPVDPSASHVVPT